MGEEVGAMPGVWSDVEALAVAAGVLPAVPQVGPIAVGMPCQWSAIWPSADCDWAAHWHTKDAHLRHHVVCNRHLQPALDLLAIDEFSPVLVWRIREGVQR